MINKNYDLLGEQLAESGLEMNIIIGAGALLMGGLSLAKGIKGSSDAAERNQAAETAYKTQQAQARIAALQANIYQTEVFNAERENYRNNRAYQWETAVKKWKYDRDVQDYQYLQAVKQYGKSVENTNDKLTYNSIAGMQAYEAEQSALNDLMTEDAFSRQGMLVDQLQAQGKAALGQAGNSRTKSLQSSIAALGRNAAIMDASLSSSVEQSQRNLQQIGLQRYAADINAKAQMMIEPERLPELVQPTMGPERIFVAPMKVQPGAVQAPTRESTFAPIFDGITSAATSIAGGIKPSYNSPPFGKTTMSAGVPLSTGSAATSALNRFLGKK